MRVSETRAGTCLPAFPATQDISGSASMRVASNPSRDGAVLRCSSVGLHFCSPASQTPPPASALALALVALAFHSQAEDSGALCSSPC